MRSRLPVGGIIHTYQKYDPKSIPGPTEPPPDLLSGAFNHLMAYGSLRELTDEELAKAVHIDPNQIAGLGPSLQSLMEMLRERKRKILATYETDRVKAEAAGRYRQWGMSMTPHGVAEAVRAGVPGRADPRSGAAVVFHQRRARAVRQAVGPAREPVGR